MSRAVAHEVSAVDMVEEGVGDEGLVARHVLRERGESVDPRTKLSVNDLVSTECSGSRLISFEGANTVWLPGTNASETVRDELERHAGSSGDGPFWRRGRRVAALAWARLARVVKLCDASSATLSGVRDGAGQTWQPGGPARDRRHTGSSFLRCRSSFAPMRVRRVRR